MFPFVLGAVVLEVLALSVVVGEVRAVRVVALSRLLRHAGVALALYTLPLHALTLAHLAGEGDVLQPDGATVQVERGGGADAACLRPRAQCVRSLSRRQGLM